MKRIAVFCGSSSGKDEAYLKEAYELGKNLAARNIELVYGGADVGLMGAVANGAIENNGKAIGVLPNFLKEYEIAHQNLTELILVDTMHQRKTKMEELADGVITLPGGIGTLEEFFEMYTWGQLGLHKKPVAILNVNGFYDELLSFISTMINKGFLREIYRQMVLVSDDINDLLDQMQNYVPPIVGRKIDKTKI